MFSLFKDIDDKIDMEPKPNEDCEENISCWTFKEYSNWKFPINIIEETRKWNLSTLVWSNLTLTISNLRYNNSISCRHRIHSVCGLWFNRYLYRWRNETLAKIPWFTGHPLQIGRIQRYWNSRKSSKSTRCGAAEHSHCIVQVQHMNILRRQLGPGKQLKQRYDDAR